MTTPANLKDEANKPVDTVSPYFVSVLYGDFGSRKTTTACSMVQENGLLITADDSWKVLLNKRHKAIYDKVRIIEYQGLSQLDHVDFTGYDTVVWDPVSAAVDYFLDLLHDHATWGGNLRETIKSTHEELKGLQNLGFVDYRVTRDKFRPILNRLFKETDAHIVLTSHMTTPVSGMGKQEKRPSIPEATFKVIGQKADIIAQLRGSAGKFVADVTQSVSQLGKSRIETIQGSMDLDSFVKAYKEFVFS